MKNIRYIIRLISAFISRFKAIFLVGILIGIAIFFSIRIVFPLFMRKNEVIGVTGRYNTSNLPFPILDLISDGLTNIDETGSVTPSLAESWYSPDKGKTWIFTLKDNVYWQDGEKIVSDDIAYEFSDVTIEKPDDKTIAFNLEDPYSPFPSIVSKPTFKKGLLGTDNYKVKDIILSRSVIQKLVLQDKDKNKIIYKFYPTEELTKLAFKLGEVKKIDNIFLLSPFDSWNTVNVTKKQEYDKVVVIFFNTQDPLLSDKTVRQALTYAIDKENLEGDRAISPIMPNSWAFNPQVKKYSYNTQRAIEIIDDLPNELKESQSIKLVSTPILLPVAEEISKSWNEIGMDTVVQVTSIIPSEYQAYITILDIPKDPDQYSLWHSTQEATNISKIASPRIDKLLEDGRSELNFEDRKQIYFDFQRFLLEDLPAAFLYYPVTYSIER